MRLSKLAFMLKQGISAKAKLDSGKLSITGLLILETIDEYIKAYGVEPCKTDISKLSGSDRSTSCVVIGRLIKQGLIFALKPDRRREYSVRLTSKGMILLERERARYARVEASLLDSIPEGKRNDFLKTLETMVRAEGQAPREKLRVVN